METIEGVTLHGLSVLQAVARHGSFSAAGRQLGLPRAAVSRKIAQLETQIGARLFRRTTRKVVLTDTAEALLAKIGPALEQITAALADSSQEGGAVAGEVRLSVSHAFGRQFVLPAVAAFVEQHPAITVEIMLDDRLDDLIEERIDLTLRVGPLPDSSLIARRLGRFDVVLAAARSLVEQIGVPPNLEALRAFPAIGFQVPGTGQVFPWPLEVDGLRQPLLPDQQRLVCNSVEGTADLVRLGCGAAILPRYLVAEELRRGSLVALFEPQVTWTAEVHLCFAERAFMPKRVRLLIDHLAAAIDLPDV